jgi:hypothetical protein
MNEKPYASDEECQEMRDSLILSGRIVPAERVRQAPSERDIKLPVRNRRINIADIPEEGIFKVRPISSPEEYERRRMSYLALLQCVLRSRILLEPWREELDKRV